MQTISISKLKAHLSAELKKVQTGSRILVLDHKRPVAELIPTNTGELFLREAEKPYIYHPLTPITMKDPVHVIDEERSDRW
ncbi:MAG: type II toxin-antitoxin system Phd/YefM family antitoxin [Spirochaetales bacterium]|nr:type II toxin-antitoxin system Phd/YefM family antitoxin [Spirochaetales bacterium]